MIIRGVLFRPDSGRRNTISVYSTNFRSKPSSKGTAFAIRICDTSKANTQRHKTKTKTSIFFHKFILGCPQLRQPGASSFSCPRHVREGGSRRKPGREGKKQPPALVRRRTVRYMKQNKKNGSFIPNKCSRTGRSGSSTGTRAPPRRRWCPSSRSSSPTPPPSAPSVSG